MARRGQKRIEVKHTSGGVSELVLESYDNRDTKFTGCRNDYIWWWDDDRGRWLFSIDIRNYLNELWC